ncbi:MAG: AAA family ATPase, partial [Xanthobacteraceae bacterium]
MRNDIPDDAEIARLVRAPREALREAGLPDDEYADSQFDPRDLIPNAQSPDEFGDEIAEQQSPRQKSRSLVAFPLVAFENITLDTEHRGYLVKGLLVTTGLTVIWGPPKCGKSFWAADLGMHIALGWDYRGHKVQQAPVVYVALEGRYGFPARIE